MNCAGPWVQETDFISRLDHNILHEQDLLL